MVFQYKVMFCEMENGIICHYINLIFFYMSYILKAC